MKLVFHGVTSTALHHVQAELESGITVVLGRDGGALDELVRLACGERRPQRGTALVLGAPVASAPRARRSVAALFAAETLPPAASVEAALTSLLAARELTLGAREVLQRWELESYAKRRPAELAPAEVRGLALGFALCDERAQVLALFEPLATALPRVRVLEALRRRSAEAAVMVCTSSLEDARALGGQWLVLDGGALSVAAAEAFTHGGAPKTIMVRSSGARRLAALLAAEDAVSAVHWDEQRAPSELWLSGPDASALGAALSRVALQSEVALDWVSPLVPPLEAVLAARAGLVQGAYEAAYRRAQAMAPSVAPAVFAPPPPAPHVPAAPYQSPSAPAPGTQTVSLGGPEKSE